MNWERAMEAMKNGSRVRRVSESVRTRLDDNVYEEGRGPIWLSGAWTDDGVFVRVLVEGPGTPTSVDENERLAEDWIEVPGK